MKTKKALNDKQIKQMERIVKELISLSLAPERYADTSSNVGIMLETMIKNGQSILNYCDEQGKRK